MIDDHCPYAAMSERLERWYTPPEDPAGTVFDPFDDTFGPIMAAIQRGDFVDAARSLLALERQLQAAR